MDSHRWQSIKEIFAAALEREADARMSFVAQASRDDLELRAELESLLRAHEEADDFIERSAVEVAIDLEGEVSEPAWVGRRLGPYRIVGEIGRGGMSEVYKAVRDDDEYHKEVAIKVLRRGFGTASLLRRFQVEKQILATLDHPNIARLLDGGRTEEGSPYLVMDYVQGRPIDEYCKERALGLVPRLELFLTLCDAVQFVHQHLMVHGDLKCANVLVSEAGAVKLLDFGIARLLGPNAPQPGGSATTLVALTPEYASPEQIRGGPITTASDVYSLGVVLFRLLTGVLPHRVSDLSSFELARKVSEEEIPAPSATAKVHEGASTSGFWRELRGDLDNIVRMALQGDPSKRYQTVEQLREDVRRHLQGFPVHARPPSVPYRVGKFLRRNSVAVAVTAVILLTLVGGVAATAWEARIANLQRARAERHFGSVRQLAHALMFDIHDSIQDLPGSLQARKLLVDRALEYLDRLSQESGGDPALLRELAAAYQRIGDIQGNFYSGANLGDTGGALQSYRKSLAIRLQLAARSGGTADTVRLATAYRLVGQTLLISNDSAGALQNVSHAAEACERAERAHRDDADILAELSLDYEAWADIYSGTFNASSLLDSAAALALLQKALGKTEQLVRVRPQDAGAFRVVALTIKIGDQHLLEGHWHAAEPYYARAERALEQSAATRAARSFILARIQQGIYSRWDAVKKMDGDAQSALAIDRAALTAANKQITADPNDAQARLSLAIDEANLADTLSMLARNREALEAVREALTVLRKLVEQDPKNGEFRGVYAGTYSVAGDVYRVSGNASEALRNYRQAAAILESIRAEDPGNADARLRLAATDNGEAAMLARMREVRAATDLYTKALELAKPEVSADRPKEQALYSTADSYSGLAELESTLAEQERLPRNRTLHRAQACSWYKLSLETWSRVKEPAQLSPDGFHPTPLSVVKREAATRCDKPAAGS